MDADPPTTELRPDYEEWLDRITATHDAVSYTLRIRLGDRATAEVVALRVAAGLVSRPAVFRHWGLPYSGRIAKLAEDGITEALGGRLRAEGTWADLRDALVAMPDEHQHTLVLTCVEGHDDDQLAAALGCDAAAAAARRERILAHLRELAVGTGLGPTDRIPTDRIPTDRIPTDRRRWTR